MITGCRERMYDKLTEIARSQALAGFKSEKDNYRLNLKSGKRQPVKLSCHESGDLRNPKNAGDQKS